ncbi:MAG: hypothetical protein FWB78_04930 [Treponema sp.]|nr:hypothetical protein [Treponema sp.]
MMVKSYFSDCPELTDERLAQLRPSRYRKQAGESGYNLDERSLVLKYRRLDGQGQHEIRAMLDNKLQRPGNSGIGNP